MCDLQRTETYLLTNEHLSPSSSQWTYCLGSGWTSPSLHSLPRNTTCPQPSRDSPVPHYCIELVQKFIQAFLQHLMENPNELFGQHNNFPCYSWLSKPKFWLIWACLSLLPYLGGQRLIIITCSIYLGCLSDSAVLSVCYAFSVDAHSIIPQVRHREIKVPYPKPHPWWVVKLGIKLQLSGARTHIF